MQGHGNSHHAQRGSAMVFSLVILLVLAVLSLGAITTSVMEESVVRNSRDEAIAFQAAEGAMRDTGEWLDGLTAQPDIREEGGYVDLAATYTTSDGTSVLGEQNAAWWSTNGHQHATLTGAEQFSGVSEQPRIIIEEHDFDSGVDGRFSLNTGESYGVPAGIQYYDVAVRGVGSNSSTQVILQGTYAVRY